ncbi:MAG: site-2 protease family protein [Methanosphaera sp.]|nr:site-2 protease family protein [Methanosphaera sp.]
MNALVYYAIGFVVVWILAFILRRRFDNISIQGIVLMLKTDRLEGLIDYVARKAPRLWRTLMNLSIPIGIFSMILMVVSILYSIEIMFETPTVSLILPGVDIPGSPIYIPFFSGLLALATVMIIHEGGHGVLSRVEGISIDSVGLLLLAVIPGAFVEPNEEQTRNVNGISRLRVYLAGPMFNIMLCIIALILTLLIGGFIADANIYTSDGLEISSVVPSSPAEGVLDDDMVIYAINNYSVNDSQSLSNILSGVSINETVSLTTDQGVYNITTGSNPNNSTSSYIGIRTQEHTVVTPEAEDKYGTIIPAILSQLEEFFYLVFFLNFAVGTFNLLPMKPLDGGLILEELLKIKIRPDRRKEFNDNLNRLTKPLPRSMRCWISRRFNSLLNFISNHELSDYRVELIVRLISSLFLAILIMLIICGFIL